MVDPRNSNNHRRRPNNSHNTGLMANRALNIRCLRRCPKTNLRTRPRVRQVLVVPLASAALCRKTASVDHSSKGLEVVQSPESRLEGIKSQVVCLKASSLY
jgi:hypothetical protein